MYLVLSFLNCVLFNLIQLFTSIYGCGSATADKWYKKGLRTIEDIRQSKELDLTEIQKLG